MACPKESWGRKKQEVPYFLYPSEGKEVHLCQGSISCKILKPPPSLNYANDSYISSQTIAAQNVHLLYVLHPKKDGWSTFCGDALDAGPGKHPWVSGFQLGPRKTLLNRMMGWLEISCFILPAGEPAIGKALYGLNAMCCMNP